MSNPNAILSRDYCGAIGLELYDLTTEQADKLKWLMQFNANSDLHEARSLAQAHLLRWHSEQNNFYIGIMTEDQRAFDHFVVLVEDFLFVHIPREVEAA